VMFSSTTRHTRFKCDWSSDVCSSDLNGQEFRHGMKGTAKIVGIQSGNDDALSHVGESDNEFDDRVTEELRFVDADDLGAEIDLRSEERRVGEGGGGDGWGCGTGGRWR